MMSFFDIKNIFFQISFIERTYFFSYIEFFGTIFGFLCIWFASRAKRINYVFGIINVLLFSIIFIQIELYASFFLQIFFLITNIYGWFIWKKKDYLNKHLKISHIGLFNLIKLISISLILVCFLMLNIDVILHYFFLFFLKINNLFHLNIFLKKVEMNYFLFLDSIITVLSMLAMILMIKKYVENWLLWIIINLLSIFIFYLKEVYFILIEYIFLLIISIYGFLNWRKKLKY
ncbi:MAG: nicotinamide riboside transporter PnuC [Arsenophonus sp.]|nr:MAG: nicotinamide riboside transporter PnuC [Arsenophonus sp.]